MKEKTSSCATNVLNLETRLYARFFDIFPLNKEKRSEKFSHANSYIYNAQGVGHSDFLTFTGEAEATESVTVLVLAVLPRRYLRRDVRHVQEGVALPVMCVMHTLPPSTPPSSDSRADVILGQFGLAAAVDRLHGPLVMMMVMMMGSG